MITDTKFENLIGASESSVLDFKRSMYSFDNDTDLRNTAKFVKDVISFTNTIRKESSYIIIGIEERADGTKELYGVDKFVDDSIFQNKVKDKVFPRPIFMYYTFLHKNKQFGIFEFPVKKYETPIVPIVPLKGLEAGKLYYRRGTTNAEALALETIQISNWLKSLPEEIEHESLYELIATYLKRLTSEEEKLSAIFPDILLMARKYNLTDLANFCGEQIKGLSLLDIGDTGEYKYRIHDVFISVIKIEVNPHSLLLSPASVKYEMEQNKDFFNDRMLFINPLFEIEDYLKRKNGLATVTLSSKTIFPDSEKDYPVYAYVFNETFASLYNGIRQKAIDRLVGIQI